MLIRGLATSKDYSITIVLSALRDIVRWLIFVDSAAFVYVREEGLGDFFDIQCSRCFAERVTYHVIFVDL